MKSQAVRRHRSCWEQADSILDVEAASVMLGLPVQSVRKLARNGVIPAFKVGKLWKFSKEKLMEFAGVESRFTTSV